MNAFLKDPRGHKWVWSEKSNISEFECTQCGAIAAFAGDFKEPYVGGFDQLSCDEVVVRKVHNS